MKNASEVSYSPHLVFCFRLVFVTERKLTDVTLNVTKMEADLYIVGNILYTEGPLLQTNNGETKSNVFEHKEYRVLNDFTQISHDTVYILCDDKNQLLELSRHDGKVRILQGKFTNPTKLIIDNDHAHSILVLEQSLKTVISYDLESAAIHPKLHTKEHTLLAMDWYYKSLIVTTDLGIWIADFNSKDLTPLTKSKNGFMNGKFADAMFSKQLSSLTVLSYRGIFIVTDHGNERLRIVDMPSEKVSTLCLRSPNISKTVNQCTMSDIRTLAFHEGALHYATSKAIHTISG